MLGAAVAFAVIWALARLLRRWLRRSLGRRRIPGDVALLTERTVYLGLLGLAVYVLVTLALGDVLGAALGVVAAAVVTSLGLQDLFKNYVAGFYVLMERHVRVGDLVQTDAFRGVVTDVGLRTSFLVAEDGARIVVPNSELFNKPVRVAPAPAGWGAGAPASDGPASGEPAEHDPHQGIQPLAR